MVKYLIAFLFLCLSTQASPVSKDKVVPAKVLQLKNDSSKLQRRNFDQQKISSYRQQTDFHYNQQLPGTSLWDRFWAWLWRWFSGVVANGYTGSFVKYLSIAALTALIIYVVIKFTGTDLRIFTGKSKSVNIPYTESADNIHEIDFNTEIEHAIGNANYRLAVRLMYLRTLKKLHNNNLINWQPEKTNQTYLQEITDPYKREQFSLLTTQFEYIWYGEFFIDQENFRQVKISYDQFNTEKL